MGKRKMSERAKKKKVTKATKRVFRRLSPGKKVFVTVLLFLLLFFGGTRLDGIDLIYESIYDVTNQKGSPWDFLGDLLGTTSVSSVSLDEIPSYTGEPYVLVDDNEPSFKEEEITDKSYESYSELDRFGRCGTATACVGQDIMPTEERGQIGMIKPTGWHLAKYDVVDGKYLYNRCHLIGYQLTGENANEKNLITGTRYLNVTGMLPFENQVADYVEETGNHVMYRVTPIFDGDDMVASGVEMEAYSVEDQGEGVRFHVYIYNVQPGVSIDYQTGESELVK